MRKWIAFLMTAIMAIAAVSCAPASESSSQPEESSAVEESSVAEESSAAEESKATEDSAAEESSAAENEGASEFTTAVEGVLTMATNAEFPPYEYYEGDTVTGIDVEIAQAIAEKLGLTLQVQDCLLYTSTICVACWECFKPLCKSEVNEPMSGCCLLYTSRCV